MQTNTSIRKALFSGLLIASLLVGMTSCQKEKHEQNNPTPTPSATRIHEYKNGDDFIRFDYNGDGSVKKATVSSEFNTNGNIIDYNISYNAAKKISEIQTTAGERIVPVYDNNVLVRADIFEGTEKTGYTTYQFVNGLLKRATLYYGAGTDFEPFFEFSFSHDNAGNNTETVFMMATGVPGNMARAGHVVYKYDAKTNPLYAQKELLALLWQSASINNITQEDHFDANLDLEDRYTYTYTYNSKGLPEHAEVKNGLPGQPPVTSQVEFVYR